MPYKPLSTSIPSTRIQNILGQIKFGLEKTRMLSILETFQHTMALSKSELGATNIAQHVIRLKPIAIPKRCRPYRLSPMESESLDKELIMLEELGFIERCEATYTSPVIMVKRNSVIPDK